MIFLPFIDGRLYSMATFFPLMVQSAVPGGLGRLLLSCGCWARTHVTDAIAKTASDTPTTRFLMRMFELVFTKQTLLSLDTGAITRGCLAQMRNKGYACWVGDAVDTSSAQHGRESRRQPTG